MTVAQLRVSRPLRAFFVVIGSWTVMRVAVLWQASAVGLVPVVEAAVAAYSVSPIPHGAVVILLSDAVLPVPDVNRLPAAHPVMIAGRSVQPTPSSSGTKVETQRSVGPTAVAVPWSAPVVSASRWSGSAWALFRPDSAGASLGTGGTLGGSQAGVRVFYEPGPRGLALTARLSAPLAMRTGREASVGIGIRGRQVGILFERRIALDRGARNAMSVTAYGGISDVALPYGLRMEGYAQAGIVGVRSRDGFADGALGITRPLVRSAGAKLSVGGAISGGAQPGVARVDIGPELVGDVPVAGKTVRVTAGWRERVAGRAAPGSGPSFSIGVGF